MKFETYETSDFYLASFLRANGFRIVDTRKEGRRVTFVFEDCPKRQQLITSYYNGEGTVNPLSFVDSMKNMKALVYNY